MPVDVAAEVIANHALSADYNVLALAAPAIAAAAAPGQFVMLKAGAGADPLLRRPFSVFEVLRDGTTGPGLTILSKRIGVSTALLYDARAGQRIAASARSGARSPSSTCRPKRGWSPAASAWRRSQRWRSRCARAT